MFTFAPFDRLALLVSLAASGCLSTWLPPPSQDSTPAASSPNAPSTPPSSATAASTPASPPDAGTDLAAAPKAPAGPSTAGPPAAIEDLARAPAVDAGADLAPPPAVACDKIQSTAGLSDPTGHHRAGQECQGCHAGGGAPTFTVGGTLYSAATGGAAVVGATINVTDAQGRTVKIISAANGNFWTTSALTFPIRVDASLCPATTPMIATVGGNGACNNCHTSAMRVHVP